MKKIRYLLKTTNNAIAVTAGLAFLFCAISLPVAAKRDKQYIAKQITNLKVDGDLSEWERAEAVAFNEILAIEPSGKLTLTWGTLKK